MLVLPILWGGLFTQSFVAVAREVAATGKQATWAQSLKKTNQRVQSLAGTYKISQMQVTEVNLKNAVENDL